MYHSNNTIVRSCVNHAVLDVNSCIGAKFAFLRSLGVDIFLSIRYVKLFNKFH